MSNVCRIFHDAENQQVGIQIVDEVTGDVLSTESAIYLTIDDVEPDGVARTAKFRRFSWKDGTSCSVKHAYFLMTDPEDGP